MTEQDIDRFMALANRRLYISLHSGVNDWRPEYGPELEAIDQEISALRLKIDRENERRAAAAALPIHVPTMVTIQDAARRTGLSYDYIRKLCAQGKITHIRAGSKFLVNLEKFVEYLNGGDAAREEENIYAQG